MSNTMKAPLTIATLASLATAIARTSTFSFVQKVGSKTVTIEVRADGSPSPRAVIGLALRKNKKFGAVWSKMASVDGHVVGTLEDSEHDFTEANFARVNANVDWFFAQLRAALNEKGYWIQREPQADGVMEYLRNA